MDHPGFELVRRLDKRRWLARFQGGVADSYFRRGTPVRLMPGAVPALLGKRMGKERAFELKAIHKSGPNRGAPEPLEPQFAVWELPDFEVRGGRIHGRSCDDLIGVACILATLIDLKKSGSTVHVLGLISRAEEIGFQGALTLAAGRMIPRNGLVVSLETSRELPPVKMGQGVIVRVGDRTSIFDSKATRYLTEIAAGLQKRGLKFQRALMSGGTCEATAYQELGFTTCAVCVALGNYHNCAPKDRIGAEFISIDDALGMIVLLVEAARQLRSFERITAQLPQRLQRLLQNAKKMLRRQKLRG
jgi:endoglucanase